MTSSIVGMGDGARVGRGMSGVRRIGARAVWGLVLGMVLTAGGAPLAAESSSDDKTVTFGAFTTSTWRSADFKGTSSREWDASGKTFTFNWNTIAGDQIGRIGATYGSSLLGCKIDEMPAVCVMSTKATFTPATDHWFFWSIYGWTNPEYTYWGNTKGGWNNEFYIMFHYDQPMSDFTKDKHVVAIGKVVVDGVTFDCFKTPRANQSQWWAVTESKSWSGSVNLKPIFAFWRTQGLGNEAIVDLGWAVEAFTGSAGKIQLTDVVIPNLAAQAKGTGAP